jgi:protein-L-isoaspartate(D-aspartate) O-methyltransferase
MPMRDARASLDESPRAHPVARRTLDPIRLLAEHGGRDLPLARAWMCEQLRATGASEDVLEAMAAVPRHGFAPPARWRVAYLDLDLWTGSTWMTAPGTVARVVEGLPRGRGRRVLEIGTGTGYQAAVLAAVGARVKTVEVSPECREAASARLRALDMDDVEVAEGDGLRLPIGPSGFDGVVINAAVSAVPTQLFAAFGARGGVLVAPLVVADGSQRLHRYTVGADGGLVVVDLGACRFPPAVTTP